jgi:hypothetical protein
MHMPKRTAKFVSAIFASFLASTPLAAQTVAAAPAADDCLSGPKGQTPAGGHWYYRVERVTKRHCWYLGDEHEKPAQTAASNPAQAAAPDPTQTAAPNPAPAAPVLSAKPTAVKTETSIADAHAELPAQPPVEPPRRGNALAQAMPANAAVTQNNGTTSTGDKATRPSIVASRWPQSSGDNPPTDVAANQVAANQPDPAAPVSPPSRSQPSSVLAAEPFAAADASSATPTYSVQMLLAAIIAALALAGVIGGVIFKFGRARRPLEARIRERRGAIWEQANIGDRTPSAEPAARALGRRPEFARDLRQANDRDDRVAEFYSEIRKLTPR